MRVIVCGLWQRLRSWWTIQVTFECPRCGGRAPYNLKEIEGMCWPCFSYLCAWSDVDPCATTGVRVVEGEA